MIAESIKRILSDSLPLSETLGKFFLLFDPKLNDTWGLVN